MRKIFVTGAIASGKSSVASILGDLGAFVVDADKLVHQLVSTDNRVMNAVRERFGLGVILEDGSVDRKALADIVFTDKGALEDLESITHPEVTRLVLEQMESAERANSEMFVAEIQLLEKSGLLDAGDHVLVIESSELSRMERLRRKGLSDDECLLRMAASPLSTDLERIADSTVVNNGDLAELTDRISKFYDDQMQVDRA